MDKKGSRSVQPISKGLTNDSKKNQDGANGKLWPRGGRRREPINGSLAAKAEVSRKPMPQRSKTIDKRPRARGIYNADAMARAETTSIEDQQEVELGSVFLPGSKKQSLNHLLNFTYTPREGHHQTARNNTKPGGRLLMNTRKHKYNKEHFLQANCQFIVNTKGDYNQYLTNPDALVDWNFVEQINLQVSEFPSCPICLYPPTAAKMTRCGHIYCWSCVLHYLALSDRAWRKCPICYEAVHKDDLKSVVALLHATFNVNEIITFKLMKRLKGSLTAHPAEASVQHMETIYNVSDKDISNIYSKLLIAKNPYILSIIEREKNELNVQISQDDNCPEKCFIEEAMNLLKLREDLVFGNCIENMSALEICESGDLSDQKVKDILDKDGISADTGYVNEPDIYSNNNQSSKYHYFYQASDGQHIYLHAINARMLEYTYGSLEFGPKTLTGKILEKEGGSMTEELRKRLRYLQHLPVTCQFEVAEIQLKQPTVNRDTIEYFRDQVDIRRKRRTKRGKEEKKRERRIADEENRQMGHYPEVDIQLESQDQFPEFGFEPRLRTESENTLHSEGSFLDTFHPSSFENEYTGPSFAKMLATSKETTPAWPTSKSTPSSDSSVKLIHATGSKPKTAVTNIKNHNSSDGEPEFYEPVPALDRSFGDVIAQAIKKAAHDISLDAGMSTNMGRKKKKNKQKILFATSMTYSGN